MLARPGTAAKACATSGYSYRGHASSGPVNAVSATITAVAPPVVASGHAAAWVGVGERRAHRWLQAGLAAFRGTTLRLYYELSLPGTPRRYVELDRTIRPGEPHHVAVAQSAPGFWRVEIDGVAATRPIYLPNTSGWRGVATAESWSAGGRACNSYGYRFEGVAGAGPSPAFTAQTR